MILHSILHRNWLDIVFDSGTGSLMENIISVKTLIFLKIIRNFRQKKKIHLRGTFKILEHRMTTCEVNPKAILNSIGETV